jgi:hypothetical protein
MDDSTSLSSLNSADFILINKEQPQLKVAAGMCRLLFSFSFLTFYFSINIEKKNFLLQ